MKKKCSSVWRYTALFAVILSMISCGNSQKKKERAAERSAAEQSMESGTVVETETVVVTVDSVAQDSVPKNVAPEKTK